MKAVVISDNNVELKEVEAPIPFGDDLLVEVESAGMNAADLLQVKGFYPPPPGYREDIPGLELAGTVVEVGPRAKRFRVGDRVMGIVGGAAQAELALISDAVAMRVPENIDIGLAGGFPEAFTTAYDALFLQGALTIGERLCVHGAAGGVGLAAIQLAVNAGARVTATSRTTQHKEELESLGAKVLHPDEMLGSGPYDVVLELVGAANMDANLKELAQGGRIVVIGVGAGSRFELDLRSVMAKRCRIMGSTLRARSTEEKAYLAAKMENQVIPLLESEAIRIHEFMSFPFSQAKEAYEAFTRSGKLGKLIFFSSSRP